MQNVALSFLTSINVSAQVGDTVYYCPVGNSGTFQVGDLNSVIQLGVIVSIDDSGPLIITVLYDETSILPPGIDDFIMFAKNKVVNTSSLIGYYADVQFVNNSMDKAELFSVGSDVFESSK